jgi:hypothetical protein
LRVGAARNQPARFGKYAGQRDRREVDRRCCSPGPTRSSNETARFVHGALLLMLRAAEGIIDISQ